MVYLLVVGAGPAGMSGALEAANAGLDVLVVDEQARAGGQIFRRPPAAFEVDAPAYAPYGWAAKLIDEFDSHPRITSAFRSTVYGIFANSDETDDPEATGFSVGMMGMNNPGVRGRRIACERV